MRGLFLRVCEMPVEDIEFGEAHGVDEGFDDGNRYEVAGGVEHDPAVGVARLVLDPASRIKVCDITLGTDLARVERM